MQNEKQWLLLRQNYSASHCSGEDSGQVTHVFVISAIQVLTMAGQLGRPLISLLLVHTSVRIEVDIL